jgi:hypothetical protein
MEDGLHHHLPGVTSSSHDSSCEYEIFVTFVGGMSQVTVELMELEGQVRYARRVLMLELNRFKATGTCNFSEKELDQHLDFLRDIERRGVRNLTYIDLLKLQKLLLRIASPN